jgi:hypothetical protein
MFVIHQALAEAIHAERRAALTQAAYQHRVRLSAERRTGRRPRSRLVGWWRPGDIRLLVRASKA